MILLLHILIAFSSIGLASYTFFKPSTKKLFASYGMMIATVGSGTYLLIALQADILRTCISGLLYVTAALSITIAAHIKSRKYAKETI